jgi:hypothetical protein
MFGNGAYTGAESHGLFEASVLSLAEQTAEITYNKETKSKTSGLGWNRSPYKHHSGMLMFEP